MARVPGRSLWLAAPAGVLCAIVVAALVWLAAPMGPVVVRWAGDVLRDASARAGQQQTDAPLAASLSGDAPLDCRDLYPADLWRQLAWFPGALLGQSAAAPDTAVPGLIDALAPTVRLSCLWRTREGQTIQTVLSTVGADGARIAEDALEGAGFTCRPAAAGVSCTRSDGQGVETHAVRDGVWLASVERGWYLEDYATTVATRLWG